MTETARDIAVQALRDREGNVSAHLDRLLAEGGLAAKDKALARELALGVLRRRATLRSVLRGFLETPGRTLPGPLEQILYVALYQLLFLERVPDFAAVNEAVEQANEFGHRRKSGLVNAVLRNIAREVSPVEEGEALFAADILPVGVRSFRKFARAVFPDPAADAPAYLGAAMSLPKVLAARWIGQQGSLKAAARVALHSNARAPLILRVNRLKADLASAAAALAADGVQTIPHVNGLSLVAADWVNVRDLAAFRDGLIQPQDPTATAVVAAAAPRKGMNVLDFCAAPGTKTTQIAESMGNEGRIVAVDVSPERLQRITDNCRRLGVSIVTASQAEQVGGMEARSFDLVLVDAPCSNTGVLARRPEARWRFDEEYLHALAADQKQLVAMAAQFVRPGGALVYSTCSIEPEENGDVARWAGRLGASSSAGPSPTLLREELTLPSGADDPSRWGDGGYFAVFRVR
jgi:16S rRNA (cytosine967-C5)-methyltransferase